MYFSWENFRGALDLNNAIIQSLYTIKINIHGKTFAVLLKTAKNTKV